MALTTTDPNRLAAELSRAADRYPRAANAALYQMGFAVGERTLPMTPERHSILIGTLYVTPPTVSAGDVVVEVGFGTAYAEAMHRGVSKTGNPLRYRKPGAEALFLQKGLDEVTPGFEANMAKLTERNAAAGIGVGSIPATFPSAPRAA